MVIVPHVYVLHCTARGGPVRPVLYCTARGGPVRPVAEWKQGRSVFKWTLEYDDNLPDMVKLLIRFSHSVLTAFQGHFSTCKLPLKGEIRCKMDLGYV